MSIERFSVDIDETWLADLKTIFDTPTTKMNKELSERKDNLFSKIAISALAQYTFEGRENDDQ